MAWKNMSQHCKIIFFIYELDFHMCDFNPHIHPTSYFNCYIVGERMEDTITFYVQTKNTSCLKVFGERNDLLAHLNE